MRSRGIMYVIISTFIFGVTPIIGKMTYTMNSNGVHLAFLRHLFVLPIFYIIIKYKKLSIHLSKKQYKDVLKIGISNALTIVMLYSSYSYINVGSATVLHFLYPLFVVLLNFILYQQKLNQIQLISLTLAILGIMGFIEKSSSSMIGIILAIVSGVFFAYYMIGMDHSSIREISPYVFNFYLVMINVFMLLILGMLTHSFKVLTLTGYFLSFIVSIFASLIGVVLLQKGIYYLGSAQAAILSTLEPITSVIIGIIFLNEQLTLLKMAGCILVLLSTFILIKNRQAA